MKANPGLGNRWPERGWLVKFRSQAPRKDRAVSQTREEGTDRSPHLPARSVCGLGLGSTAVGGWEEGGRAPPAAPRTPHLRPPHSAHSFARVRSSLPKRGDLFDLRFRRAAHFPAEALRLLLLYFFFWYLVHLKKGRPGAKPFLPSPSEQHREAAGCRRAGLALRNSGCLCSPQLFPDHLTRQLLERRCC